MISSFDVRQMVLTFEILSFLYRHVHGFLDEIGQGIQHIASRVDNLAAFVQRGNDYRKITGEVRFHDHHYTNFLSSPPLVLLTSSIEIILNVTLIGTYLSEDSSKLLWCSIRKNAIGKGTRTLSIVCISSDGSMHGHEGHKS